jgi:hypothetical protein
MAFKLAIADTVVVPVKFSMADGAKTKQYSFTLSCERLGADAWDNSIRGDDGLITNDKIKDKLIDITSGWTGQTFVLLDDGTPADFSREAFEFLLTVPGLLDVVTKSYMKESVAKAKN